MCPSDTTPEAWQVFLELQCRMPPAEKMRRALELSAGLRRAAEAGLRERYPHAGDREIFLRLARLTLGQELFERVYGEAVWPDSAENVLLAKLQGHHQDGEISERQWSEILGILAANPALDFDYLNEWAQRLILGDLWERALKDAGRSGTAR